jgi:hypothetical protein
VRQHLRGRIEETLPAGDATSPESEVYEPSDDAPCERHPDWRPARWLPSQPRQLAETCPHCAASVAHARRHTGSVVEPANNPRSTTEATFGQDYRRVNAALEAYNERQASRPGHVVSGSEEERRALQIIADRREDERDRARMREGIVRFSHIENGCLVDYVETRRWGRKQLVRVGPQV